MLWRRQPERRTKAQVADLPPFHRPSDQGSGHKTGCERREQGQDGMPLDPLSGISQDFFSSISALLGGTPTTPILSRIASAIAPVAREACVADSAMNSDFLPTAFSDMAVLLRTLERRCRTSSIPRRPSTCRSILELCQLPSLMRGSAIRETTCVLRFAPLKTQ